MPARLLLTCLAIHPEHPGCGQLVNAVPSRPGSREQCRASPIIFDNVLVMRRASCGFAPIFLPPDETSGRICFAAWRIGRSLDHIPHEVLSWITTRNYGFSDAADLFVFISGYTAAFVLLFEIT